MSRRKERKAAKAAAKAAKANVKAEYAAQRAQGKKGYVDSNTQYTYKTVDGTTYSPEAKPKKKSKIPFVILIVIILGLFGMCSGEDEPEDTTKETEEVTYEYMTEATWAALEHYAFAIENDNYGGDVFEAGSYIFYPTLVNAEPGEMVKGKTPIVWDIYVSENEYSNVSQLSDSEFMASVGGIEQYSTTLELKKGQYVYIKYNDVVGEPMGALQIELQK